MLFLIIEDDPDAIELVTAFLEHGGHKVIQARNGREGLELYAAHAPDAVFLDIGLPDLNGVQVLKRIRGSDAGACVIVMTGTREAENVVSVFRSGALDCLLKPLNYDYLKAEVLPKIHPRKR